MCCRHTLDLVRLVGLNEVPVVEQISDQRPDALASVQNKGSEVLLAFLIDISARELTVDIGMAD